MEFQSSNWIEAEELGQSIEEAEEEKGFQWEGGQLRQQTDEAVNLEQEVS